jgi:phytoene dehydrogenase-like protein
MDPVDHFHLPDGSTFHVPADLDAYRAALDAMFPHESPAIAAFFAEVRDAYLKGLLFYFRGQHTADFDRYRSPDGAAGARSTLPRSETQAGPVRRLRPLGLAARACLLRLRFDAPALYFLGNYYPRGGSQVFADDLAARAEELGCALLMQSMVRRILVENGTACGVEIETGTRASRRLVQVRAGVVVSNADLLQTVERLVGPEHVDPAYVSGIRAMRATLPCFLTHIGLRNIDRRCYAKRRATTGHRGTAMKSRRMRSRFSCRRCSSRAWRLPAVRLRLCRKLTDVDYDAVTDWAGHKREVEDDLMARLERAIPGISENVVTKLSASALTSYRFHAELPRRHARMGNGAGPARRVQTGARRSDQKSVPRGPLDSAGRRDHAGHRLGRSGRQNDRERGSRGGSLLWPYLYHQFSTG